LVPFTFPPCSNFNLKKTKNMFKKWLDYRKEHQVDSILNVDMTNVKEGIASVFTEYYTGIDPQNRPVKYQRYHKIDKEKVLSVDMKEWWQFNFLVTEEMLHVIFPYCSGKANERVDKCVIIMDFEEIDLTPLLWNGKLREYFQLPGKVGQECYPEI